MHITVQFHGQLREAARRDQEIIELPEMATLEQAIRQQTALFGDLFERVALSRDGGIHPSLIVAVNDEVINRPYEKSLNEGDRVSLISPIAGG